MDTYDASLLTAFAAYQASAGLATGTTENRESTLRTLATFTGKPLLDLTPNDLRAYMGQQHLTKGTKRTYRIALRTFYDFLVREQLLESSPATGLPEIRVSRGTPRPFTREQIDAMLHSGAYRRTRVMILLGYYQGFRVSQIARVHGHDVDLIGRTITTVGKGSKEATLPLHPIVADIVDEMPRSDYWFPARRGRKGPVSGSAVTDLITKAKRRAGINDDRLTPHSLRHSFGSHLVEAGVDVRIVQELMMHESLATTQIYTGVTESMKRRGIDALRALDAPAPDDDAPPLRLAA